MKRILAALLTFSIIISTVSTALAAAPDTGSVVAEGQKGYYGSQLTDSAAIAFYQALETMDFMSGENLTVTDPAVLGLAGSFASGSNELIRSFGAAVDSFRYDHTELFYVDWDMLSVSVGKKSGEYVVNIGTGRTDSYLRDKTANITAQIAAYNVALDAMVAEVREAAGSDPSVKDIARAANDAVCQAVTYDFCDDANGNATDASKYIRTAYGALVNGRAVCEGYSRLFKAVLDELGVECELVSGYYLNGESFEPHMWNYVQDEDGNWYAVDVTMNASSASTANPQRKYEKYFWQPEELFGIDHIEDGRVSSVEYEMPYPELYKFWQTPASSGKFTSGYGAYGDKSGFWFSYDGKSAEDLKKEGLYMGFRVATTNTGEVVWSPWQTAEEMMRLYQQDGKDNVISDNGKTYILMSNIAMSNLEAGIFDIPEDAQNVVNGILIANKYSEEAATSHLIEKMYVKNPSHDPTYIAPAYVHSTEPANLLQAWMDVTKGTQHVEVTYGDPLREVGGGMELDWSVSSYNRRDLSLEAVKKYAKVENVAFDGDRTISFDFTPSRMYNHNMIFYDFTVKNMVNIIAGGKDGVALSGFSIGCRYEDDIACCKIYNDGRLYVNAYAQPSIAMNGDLSVNGWTYEENGKTKRVSESQRSQMALVVTQPNDSKEMADAAMAEAGAAAVATESTTYEIDLNICGKILTIPNGSYMRLNLGIPDAFAQYKDNPNITFKLYHFRRDATGKLDYRNPEEIECVMTPYGIIAEVNSFSPYALVAIDNSRLSEEQKDTSKRIALVCNGHGGKVDSSISTVGTLKEGQTATYTLTPEAGYDVEFALLNGADVPIVGNTITLSYDALKSSSNTLEVGYVAESVKEAEADAGINNVSPGVACVVTFYTDGGSAVASAHVESGSTVAKPADPTKSGYRFEGWYADHELKQLYDFSTPVTASITLYAKWTKTADSGSSDSDSDSDPVDQHPVDPKPVVPDPVVPVNPPAVWENPFADVNKQSWYYGSVQFAVENGLFHGTSDTTFDPTGDMTREMLATVLYRLAKEPETGANRSFSDVAEGQYYTEAVAWAAEQGIVSGYGGGKFGRGDLVTREQLAVMLWRYAGSPAGAGNLDSFTDTADVDTWAMDALRWAVEQKIVNGGSDGALDPRGNATRAEVAAMLMRYCETL